MEPKHFLVLCLIIVPYVLSDRQCTESGQRIVNAHIENVVDNVSTSSPFYIFVFTCTKYVHNLCKVSIFYPNLQTLDDRTYDLDNVVRASSQVLKEVLLPQIEQMFDLKIGQMKTELKQELIGTVTAKVNEVKDDLMIVVEEKLTGKVEHYEMELKIAEDRWAAVNAQLETQVILCRDREKQVLQLQEEVV